MRIKRVTIHGFKTFARSTEFIFDPGTTAVVGPNGSGKSNIVDAVRWCLGEQSFSLLRSKKTSDVIFAGSDKKARLGMAEVTITLDNSAGEIPIDFTEVEISRRAYRDGDNEYLVNGQRVRLQDVVELLSQTGLGKRTYSVVGQGLIDRTLSMAPEERRALFEEAAGISGYQIKRATTMRRLEATQQNLTRVQDIVAELSPRLGYLRRQADRAREREQLVGDLQLLLRDWYGFRWHTTLRLLEEHHAAEQATRLAVESRQAALAEAGARIDELRARQRDLRTTLADLHASGSGLHQEAERVGRDLAVVQERVRQLQARQEDAQRDLGPLEVEQSMLVKRAGDLAAAVVETQRVWEERQREVDALQTDVGLRQQERTRVQALLDTARRELKRTQDQQTGTRGRLTQLLERRAALLAQQTQQEQAVRAAQAEVEATVKAVQEAEAFTSVLDQRVAGLQEAQAATEQELGALRGRLRAAEEERQGADRALDRLQTRLDLLSRLRNDGAGYASGVRSVLQATHLKGILGTVASLLRATQTWKKAIETALGGALQNVVAERWADATAGIEWLKQQRAGRATFLPLDRLSVLPAITAPRTRGILGNALDLVEYDPRIDEAARQLLNRVWVAEDLPSARAALDGIAGGPRPTVVTLEGEIVRPGGAVTGGPRGPAMTNPCWRANENCANFPARLQPQRQPPNPGRRTAVTSMARSRQADSTRVSLWRRSQKLRGKRNRIASDLMRCGAAPTMLARRSGTRRIGWHKQPPKLQRLQCRKRS
ncbi:MAG: chromosome segregation protein SMC [Anaerolineales bacterium]|nr:chromosome segregation protein SMC [Anaerolineales bacterium]